MFSFCPAVALATVHVHAFGYIPPPVGRAWLMLALNEQALESYLRIFLENQDTVLEYYTM